jgi:SIR2-like domain
MADLLIPPTRDAALGSIATAAMYGYLGLFAGTGFSKAATRGRAPGFDELLTSLATRLDLSPDFDSSPAYRRKSLPQVASQLLREYSAANPPPEQASERFRDEIAELCNLMPDGAIATRLRSALRDVRPDWIITTNYDLILEALIDDAESVLPTQPLVPRASRVPIYHLHGHRHNSSTIRITEEDYVGLLGPIDYQRLKLPLLLLESTTLMLGYALGDINVRAAMAWSRSFRGEQGLGISGLQGRVYHALRRDSPSDDPYAGPNGEIVLEIDDLASFLEEIGERRASLDSYVDHVKTSVQEFLADPANAPAVSSDVVKRHEFLTIVESSLSLCPPTQMIDFLSRALDPVWQKAREDLGFEHYDIYLGLLIDVLERISVRSVNPGLLFYLGDALDKVGWYLDPRKPTGTAWEATDTWMSQHARIPDDLKRELRSYATAYERVGLDRALTHVGA